MKETYMAEKQMSRQFNKPKTCKLTKEGITTIDYKDLHLLKEYVSETGKIMPSRITNISLQNQKKISTAIKRARYIALLSYSRKV